jgi:hypothetical protein
MVQTDKQKITNLSFGNISQRESARATDGI